MKKNGARQHSDIMTLREVAKYLGLHVMTVYKLTREGRVPAHRDPPRGESHPRRIDSRDRPGAVAHRAMPRRRRAAGRRGRLHTDRSDVGQRRLHRLRPQDFVSGMRFIRIYN